MKYVYNGEYREFRGRVFLKGVPVEITDKGTLELIKHESDFKEVPDETQVKETTATEVLKPKFNRSEWMKRMHAEGRMKK